MTYDWKDAPDKPDIADPFTRNIGDRWGAAGDADDGYQEHRDRSDVVPVTRAELDDYRQRRGKITYHHPQQEKRDRRDARRAARIDTYAALNGLQRQWIEKFDPVAIEEANAVSVLKQYLEIIKPTSRRNYNKVSRIRGVLKAVMEGWTQARVAEEWKIDSGFLSRQLGEVYEQCPNLKPAIKCLNLLNKQGKRFELSSSWKSSLQGGAGKTDGDDDLNVEPESPYDHIPWVVKVAELRDQVFPPIPSNWCQVVSILREEVEASFGTQRVLIRAKLWGRREEEADWTDYRAKLWQDDTDQLHDTIDEWHRLRRCAGLSDVGELTPDRALSAARHFYRAEAIRRATIARLPSNPVEWPSSATPCSLAWHSPFIGAPSTNHGYLGPIGRAVPSRKFKAPLKIIYRRPDGYAEAAPIERRIKNELALYLERRDPDVDAIRSTWVGWASQTKVLEPPAWTRPPPKFVPDVAVHVVKEVRGVQVFYRHYPIASNRCTNPETTFGSACIASDLPVSGLVKFDRFPLSGPLGRGKRTKRYAAEVVNQGRNVNVELRRPFPELGSVQIGSYSGRKQINSCWTTIPMNESKWSNRPMCNAVHQTPYHSVRGDEIISGWPVLVLSTHQKTDVLFSRPVTASNQETYP